MARGVFLGASTPFHPRNLNPGTPPSAMVGSSGKIVERLSPLTAIQRARPVFQAARYADSGPSAQCASPDPMAAADEPPPL